MPVATSHDTLLADAQRVAGPLPDLLVGALHVAASMAVGLHGRRRVGQGDAFWQFRPYIAGDAPQTIDWRRSARGNDVFVRQFEWEAVQSVWLWRDASASMDYASAPGRQTKRNRADVMALALAQLLIRAGERVSIIGAGSRSGHGRTRMESLANDLAYGAAASDTLPTAIPLPAHAEVVLFSDFLDPIDAVAPKLTALAQRAITGYLVHIIDPAEETLPFDGRVQFQGVETDTQTLVPRVDRVRGDYQARFTAHRDAIADLARSIGWTTIQHRTDQPPQHALLALHQALTATHGHRL